MHDIFLLQRGYIFVVQKIFGIPPKILQASSDQYKIFYGNESNPLFAEDSLYTARAIDNRGMLYNIYNNKLFIDNDIIKRLPYDLQDVAYFDPQTYIVVFKDGGMLEMSAELSSFLHQYISRYQNKYKWILQDGKWFIPDGNVYPIYPYTQASPFGDLFEKYLSGTPVDHLPPPLGAPLPYNYYTK